MPASPNPPPPPTHPAPKPDIAAIIAKIVGVIFSIIIAILGLGLRLFLLLLGPADGDGRGWSFPKPKKECYWCREMIPTGAQVCGYCGRHQTPDVEL